MRKFIGVIIAIVAFALLAVGCQRAERPGRDATYEITITNQSSWEGATHINFYDFDGVVKGTADIQSGKASVTLKKGNYFAQIGDVPETVSYTLPVLSSTETTGEIILTDAPKDSTASYYGVLGVITKNGLPLKNYCAILTYKPDRGDGYTLDPINTDKNGVISVSVQTGDYHVTVYSHSDAYTTYEFDVSVNSGTRFFLAELTQADKVTHDEPIDPGRGDEDDPDVTDPDNPDNPDPDDPDNPDVTDPDNPDPDNPDPDNPDVTDPDDPDPDNPDVTDPDDPDNPDEPDEPDYPEPDPDDIYTKRPDPNNPPKSNLYKGKMTFWVLVNRLNGYKITRYPSIKITNAETGEVEYTGYVQPVKDVTNPALEFNMLEIKLAIATHYVNITSLVEGYDYDPNHNFVMDENNYVLDIRVASHLTDKSLGHTEQGDVLPDLTFDTLNEGEKKLSEILTTSKMAVMYYYANINDSGFESDATLIKEIFTKYGDDVAFIFFTTAYNTAGLADQFKEKYEFTGKYYIVSDNGYNYKNNLIYNGGNRLSTPLVTLVDSGGVYFQLFTSNVSRIAGIKRNFETALEINRFITPPKGSSDPVVNPTTPVVVPTSFVSAQGILPERRNLFALAA